jgi:hypothetical protein
MAAGSEQKKGPPVSPNMQAKQAHTKPASLTQPQPSHQPLKVQQTHLPQQQTPKLQTIISKPGQQSTPNKSIAPIAAPPIPKTNVEAVQPEPKLPSVPARPPQPLSSSPPSTEPPKIKAPQLSQPNPPPRPLQTQTSQGSSRGPPPAIPPRSYPVRSGSVTSPPVSVPQVRPVRRQTSISQMPQCTPQPIPAFVIPQRRGSITRQTSLSTTSSGVQMPKRS